MSRHFLRGRRGGEQPADNRHGFPHMLTSPACLVCSTEARRSVGDGWSFRFVLGLPRINRHKSRYSCPNRRGSRYSPWSACRLPGSRRREWGGVHQYPNRRGSRYSSWSAYRMSGTWRGKGGIHPCSDKRGSGLAAGLYVGCQDLVRRRFDL